MNKDLWQKACAVLLMLLLSLAGWGLWKVDAVDERTARMEERMLIWHTGTGTASYTPDMAVGSLMLASQYSSQLTCGQRLAFSQKTMLRAYTQIKNGAYDPALKTLMVGLEDSGLTCREYKGSLECNHN